MGSGSTVLLQGADHYQRTKFQDPPTLSEQARKDAYIRASFAIRSLFHGICSSVYDPASRLRPSCV